MAEGRRQRRALRRVSVLALAVALLLTGLVTWATFAGVAGQEHRLLRERTAEVALVLNQSIMAVPTSLAQQGAVLDATNGSVNAYQQAAAKAVALEPGHPTFAWLRAEPDGSFQVIAAAGGQLHVLQSISDARTKTMTAALHAKTFVPTPVIGRQRILGFAIGAPVAPPGTVLYRESVLGPVVSPPRATANSPYSELDVVLYGTPTVSVPQVLTSTTRQLPLHGGVRRTELQAGTGQWLLTVKARSPLVGGLTTDAPWIALGVGLVGSLLIALVVEIAVRRRDTALTLYETEHHVAETLQRSLLPQLPDLPGLELAARYLASGIGQQVGGDWFDVFPVADGRVGLAIGDVVGHNLTAASAMAQIRALLRGYAIDGDEPAAVVARLANAVSVLQLTQFVTVFYALLGAPASDGSRTLTYTNAGHVPPILRHPDGTTRPLTDGDSVVIGAPIDMPHAQGTAQLDHDCTLVLFTDGLVEVPGDSLTDGLRELEGKVAQQHDVAPEALCDNLLASVSTRNRRDDVALLVVHVGTEVVAMPSRPTAEAVAGSH